MSSTKPTWVAFDFLGVFLPLGLSAGLNYLGIETQLSARVPVLRLLPELKRQGIHLALASNSRRRWILPWLEKAGEAEYFEVIVTPDDDVMKPEPEFYAKLIELCGVSPEQILFLDDRAVNVDAARREGLRAEQCDDLASIVTALKSVSIKVPDQITE